MPRPSPYPPLELDFEEISTSGLRHAPTAEPTTAPSDKRHTIAPEFDIEAFAREAMSDEGPVSGATAPDPPTSEVRAVTDTAKTAPQPAATPAPTPGQSFTSRRRGRRRRKPKP